MTQKDQIQIRMDRVRKLLGCETDVEIEERLEINQPRMSRWRNVGFHKSTAALFDALLSKVDQLRKEILELKRNQSGSE